ncbi:MAG TPA: hypothetical protein VFW11_19400 [Cyclobacteriaceae bacterium]|nr:hypothetical protein [Cyclobacteriaceae bacterium]
MRTLLLILIIGISANLTWGQTSDKKKTKEKYQTSQPTSMDPSMPLPDYGPRKTRVKSKGITYDAERNYYQQLARVEKSRREAAKEMAKPQYSDPLYFGHKHPPKKHKAGKLKYCKECGIRH